MAITIREESRLSPIQTPVINEMLRSTTPQKTEYEVSSLLQMGQMESKVQANRRSDPYPLTLQGTRFDTSPIYVSKHRDYPLKGGRDNPKRLDF